MQRLVLYSIMRILITDTPISLAVLRRLVPSECSRQAFLCLEVEKL